MATPESISMEITPFRSSALGAIAARAVGGYRKAVDLDSTPALRADYAEALHLAKQPKLALEQYQIARRDDDKLATSYCGEALLRLECKDKPIHDLAIALKLMKRAIELVPDSEAYKGFLKRIELAARTESSSDKH